MRWEPALLGLVVPGGVVEGEVEERGVLKVEEGMEQERERGLGEGAEGGAGALGREIARDRSEEFMRKKVVPWGSRKGKERKRREEKRRENCVQEKDQKKKGKKRKRKNFEQTSLTFLVSVSVYTPRKENPPLEKNEIHKKEERKKWEREKKEGKGIKQIKEE